jgi:hypothetical protein
LSNRAPTGSTGRGERDLNAIRAYHAKLGRIYSRDSTPVARAKADRHIESMRRVNDTLAIRTGRRPKESADLMQDLAASYEARGKADSAAAVKAAVERSLTTRGHTAAASNVSANVTTKSVKISRTVSGREGVIATASGRTGPVIPVTGRGGAGNPTSPAWVLLDQLQRALAQDRDSVQKVSTELRNAAERLQQTASRPLLATRRRVWNGRLDSLAERLRSVMQRPSSEAANSITRDLQAAASEDRLSSSLRDSVNSLIQALQARQEELKPLYREANALTREIAAALDH